MGIFDSIFGKKSNIKILDHPLNELNEISAAKRIELFGKMVTPIMQSIGLTKWDGKYTWFNDFNKEGIKHVVYYQVLKGYSGSFSYGNCFSFVPTVSNGKKMVNHKTDKSTILHLWERLDGWKNSFEKNRIKDYDKISHWNEKEFKRTMNLVLEEYPSRIQTWFEENKSIDQNITTAKNQIELGGAYDVNGPDQKYVLGFLYAQKGEIGTAKKFIHNYYNSLIKINESFKVEMELVLERIDKITPNNVI